MGVDNVIRQAKRFGENPQAFGVDQVLAALKAMRDQRESLPATKAGKIRKYNKAEGILQGALNELGYQTPPSEPGTATDTMYGGDKTTDEGTLDDYLRQVGPDENFLDQFTGKNAEIKLLAATYQDAAQGRRFGVQEWQDRMAEFENDPLVQALNEKSQGLLDEELISDEMLNEMLGSADASLAQSYQNQSAGLNAALGGRGMDPRSDIAKGLAARQQFNVLQQSAQNRIGTTMEAKQMNRSALEDAMRLGLSTSGYTQGVLNQGTANISNLLAGQPLSQIGPESAATMMAMNFDPNQGQFGAWGQAGLGLLNTVLGGASQAGGYALMGG